MSEYDLVRDVPSYPCGELHTRTHPSEGQRRGIDGETWNGACRGLEAHDVTMWGAWRQR